MAWNPITPVTFTGSLPVFSTGYQDLDLSPYIGAQKTLALISIYGWSNRYYSIRPKGDTHDYVGAQYSTGCKSIWRRSHVDGGNGYYQYWALTDSNGVIQWVGSAAQDPTYVKVHGYLDVRAPNVQAGSILQSTTVQMVDLSAVVGNRRVFVILRVRGDGVNTFNTHVTAEEYGNPYKTIWNAGSNSGYGRSSPTTPWEAAISVVTDENGRIQAKNEYDGSGTIYFDVLAYAPLFGSEVQVHSGPAPGTETELDLSQWVGKRRQIVSLRGISNHWAQVSYLGFMPGYDPYPLIIEGSSSYGGHQHEVISLLNSTPEPYQRTAQCQTETDDRGVVIWKDFGGASWGSVIVKLLGYTPTTEATKKSPTPFHSHWGDYSTPSDLPNVSGSSTQDSALEVGDRAYVLSTSQTYQCTVATLGGATWTSMGASDDADAVHDDEVGEINALTAKVYPTDNDVLLIEDVADSNNKKSIVVSDLPTGAATDPDAIHDNVAAEISALTQKTVPAFDDLVLIEDSEASNAKKRAKLRNIPRAGSKSNLWFPPSSPHAEDDEFDSDTLDTAWQAYNSSTGNYESIVSGLDAYDGSYSGDDLRASINSASRRSWILMQCAPGIGMRMVKPYTFPTNVLVMARLKFSQPYSGATQYDRTVALTFTEDNAGKPGSNNYASIYLNWTTTGGGIVQARFYERDGGAAGLDNSTTDVDQQGQALEYVAIHKIGTTYHGWIGTAAGNWIYMGNFSLAATMAHVGIYMYLNSTTLPGLGIVGCDFIRFYETDDFLF